MITKIYLNCDQTARQMRIVRKIGMNPPFIGFVWRGGDETDMDLSGQYVLVYCIPRLVTLSQTLFN